MASPRIRLPAAYDEIATKGFCTVEGDWRPTLAAVATPLRHPVAGLGLAVNLTVPTYAATPEHLEDGCKNARAEMLNAQASLP